jgi:hypothetical protein
MANDRGCIAERLRRPDRMLTGNDDTDTARLLGVVKQAADDWEAVRQACGRHAADLHATAGAEARVLFSEMLAVSH